MRSATRRFVSSWLGVIMILVSSYVSASSDIYSLLKKSKICVKRAKLEYGTALWPRPSKGQLTPRTTEQSLENPGMLVNEAGDEGVRESEFLLHIHPGMTTFEHFVDRVEHLETHKMIPNFLIHSNPDLVKEAIVTFKEYGAKYFVNRDDIFKALILSLDRDLHERVVDLLKAVKKRHAALHAEDTRRGLTTPLESFIDAFFDDLVPEENGASLKRFLTVYKATTRKTYPVVFHVFCQRLVHRLKCNRGDPNSKKMLVDFVGQPSLLTPQDFVEGFLSGYRESVLADFLEYDWKEAIETVMNGEVHGRRDILWTVILRKFPREFPEGCISSPRALEVVLIRFKTKQVLEEEWTKNNKVKFDKLFPDLLLSDLWNIVSEYIQTDKWIII